MYVRVFVVCGDKVKESVTHRDSALVNRESVSSILLDRSGASGDYAFRTLEVLLRFALIALDDVGRRVVRKQYYF